MILSVQQDLHTYIVRWLEDISIIYSASGILSDYRDAYIIQESDKPSDWAHKISLL
jgi:hypothetical protein